MTTQGSFFKHYKGNIYYVHFVATDSESTEEIIVYQQAEILLETDQAKARLVAGKIWCRPASSFYDIVPTDDKPVLRFTPVYNLSMTEE